MIRLSRLAAACLALVVATGPVLIASDADARIRGSFGSRGVRSFSPPPPTATAPRAVQPLQRSVTQPSRPGTVGTAPASRGLFNRPGLIGGLAAGFLGAGLIGLLMGHGFLGGLAGFASVLGLLLQIILVVVVARLAWSWWQRRQQPAMAGGPSYRDMAPGDRPAFGLGGTGTDSPPVSDFAPDAADFDTFERLLSEIQMAYGREDLVGLRRHLTPEMLSYFAEELTQNASHGVINEITDVKLEQGDLAEAWQEGDDQYATVAMRYSLTDRMVDRTTGKVADGGDQRQEATELWTFRRARGGQWLLSAIQQA